MIAFDTRALLKAYFEFVDLSPINSGSTIHVPARRGLTTFARANALSYKQWQRLRGKVDTIKEITILDGIPNAKDFIIDVQAVKPRQP